MRRPDMIILTEFQSTPPRGWRPGGGGAGSYDTDFNPLHREGGDGNPKFVSLYDSGISIHSTARVETVYGKDALWVREDFNPLHREGGDWDVSFLAWLIDMISIHSTARVETAILHNNHYYSSSHFHKQIISHPLKSRPTIPAHSQIRSHCANFPVRIPP